MQLYDHLKGLTSQKKIIFDPENTEHTKNYIPYIISRFISMIDIFLPYVNEMNKYLGQMRKQDHRLFFWALLPERDVHFNYLKKKKDKNVLSEQEDIAIVSRYFNFGTKDAKAAIDILTSNQIQQIKNKFKHGRIK